MQRADAGTALVADWFGPQFAQLHPLLQRLHRHGGRLHGTIDIRTGRGLAGWLGRRLAASVGIPVDLPQRGFEVTIRHTATALEWSRRFDDGSVMRSLFEPVGTWPLGYWKESTGPLQMRLGVDTHGGGWRWQPRQARFHGIRLPLWLLPATRAGKRIEDGRYVFEVEFALLVVGTVLRYGGRLEAM